MNTNTLNRKTKAELINIINSQNEQIANLSAKIDDVTANNLKNNDLKEKINNLAKKYQEKEIELDRLKKSNEDDSYKQSRELQKTILKYNNEIREKDIKYNSLMDSHNILSAKNDELKLKQREYDNKIKNLSDNVYKLEVENNSLFTDNENKNKLINNMSSTIDANTLEIKILKNKLSNKKSLLKVNAIIYIICMIVVTLLGILVF